AIVLCGLLGISGRARGYHFALVRAGDAAVDGDYGLAGRVDIFGTAVPAAVADPAARGSADRNAALGLPGLVAGADGAVRTAGACGGSGACAGDAGADLHLPGARGGAGGGGS